MYGYLSTYNQLVQPAISNLQRYAQIGENELADQASADNTLAYSKAYNTAARQLSRMGVNPNSGRFAGMARDVSLNQAAAEASARNQARIQARNENFSRAGILARLGASLALTEKNLSRGTGRVRIGGYNRYQEDDDPTPRYANRLREWSTGTTADIALRKMRGEPLPY